VLPLNSDESNPRTVTGRRLQSLRGLVQWSVSRCSRQDCDSPIAHAARQSVQRRWFRGIGEYKIDFGPGWRIYLARDGIQIIVLLGGGSKKGQQKDIDRAVELWEDYKRRKAQMLKDAGKQRKE
jgi:hypothetical protein